MFLVFLCQCVSLTFFLSFHGQSVRSGVTQAVCICSCMCVCACVCVYESVHIHVYTHSARQDSGKGQCDEFRNDRKQ